MKKVLIITYYWPPSGGAGVQRWLKLSKYLCEAGADCTVLTVDPAQATYPVLDESHQKDVHPNLRVVYTSTREPFGLYKKISGRKKVSYGGFANESTTFTKKIARFIRGNFFIPDARKGWNKFVIKEASRLLSQEQFDGVIISTPPHSTQLVGLALKKRFPIFWIADMRDPWTDIYYYKMMLHTALAKKKDAALERRVLEEADQILVVSESIRQLFGQKLGAADKIHVLANGFDPEDFTEHVAMDLGQQGALQITYTGTLSQDYPIDALTQALAQLTFPFQLRFVGEVTPALRKAMQDYPVEYTGYVDHSQSLRYLKESDALLLIIPQVTHNEGILTGKLFEYLASEKPILGFGPTEGDASRIISQCNAGKMYDYVDAAGAASFLTSVREGKFAEQLVNRTEVQKYSRAAQAKTILDLLP